MHSLKKKYKGWMCLCLQSSRWRGRRPVCRGSGLARSLHHLLLHLPSLSGKRTRTPAPLYGLFFYLVTSSLHFHTCFSLFFLTCCPFIVCLPAYVSVSAITQCVCTLSPSPSKLSKPLPLDSLQLPLAPGLVTHNVSLYWPLWECDCVWFTLKLHWITQISHLLWGVCCTLVCQSCIRNLFFV